MVKALSFVTCPVLLCLAIMLPTIAVQAADEDLTSSVYLVFDPETGDFVTVDDPNRTSQNHEAQDPADMAIDQPTSINEPDTRTLSLTAVTAIVAGILGVVIFWSQRRKRKPDQSMPL
jgi:hypothetical protein